jgi:diaminobutyrate-2-oxoglutarate transaminase
MQRAALRRGLMLEIGGREDCVLRLLPPLNRTRRTTDEALAIIRAGFESVQSELEDMAAR